MCGVARSGTSEGSREHKLDGNQCSQLIEPYGGRMAPDEQTHSEPKSDSQTSISERDETHVKSKPNVWSTTSDSDSKEIKTIYIGRVNSVTTKTVEPVDVPKVVNSLPAQSRRTPSANRSLVTPHIVPCDGLTGGKYLVGSRRELISSVRDVPVKLSHTRRLSTGRFDMQKMSVSLDYGPFKNVKRS